MSIAKMSKVSIALHSSHKENLLKELQDLSALHIIKIEKQEKSNDQEFADEDTIRQLESQLNRLSDTISFVKRFIKNGGFLESLVPQKLPISHETYKETIEHFKCKEMIDRIRKIECQLSKLRSDKEHLLTKKETIEPWIELDTPIELLKETTTTRVLPGRINKRLFSDDAQQKAKDMGIQIAKIAESKNEIFVILLYHKNNDEKAGDFLDEMNFAIEDFRGFTGKPVDILKEIEEQSGAIETECESLLEKAQEFVNFYDQLLITYDHINDEVTRLQAIRDAVRTKTTYIINGWVETKQKESLQKLINSYDAAVIDEIEPEQEEMPPVKLINKSIFAPFEIVTQLYGTPNYRELDPSPHLSIFFALFFGLCITDAGYGIVLALIALLLMKKMPSGKKFLWLLFIGALFTIVEGALLGGWFGDLFKGTSLGKGLDTLIVFDPMKSYFVFFRLAILLGAVQVFWGLLIKMYEDIKSKHYADAFIEEIIWIALLSSLAVLLFATDLCIQVNLSPMKLIPESFIFPSLLIVLACSLIIIFFGARKEESWFFRLIIGVLRLFILGGIFSYMGDFLSYIRLMALGLVTAGIAGAINEIARMTLGIPVAGVILFIIILIGGHLFNIGINTLGGFVHTLRLQYVEFFQKFFTGGGKPFNPLRKAEKYVVVKQV